MTADYALLAPQLEALLDSRDWLTNSAETSAFLMEAIWAGFYLHRKPETLWFGPFQGKPACHPISFAKGVCGANPANRHVHAITDHIA